LYILHQGKLRRLSTDHSHVEELGIPDWLKFSHPERSLVTSYLAPNPKWVEKKDSNLPEISSVEIVPGDVLFACSDGLWESCYPWALESTLNYYICGESNPSRAGNRIMEFLHNNFSDNSTASILYYGEPKLWGGGSPSLHPMSLLLKGLDTELQENIEAEIGNFRSTYGEKWEEEGPAWWNTIRDSNEHVHRRVTRSSERDVYDIPVADAICIKCCMHTTFESPSCCSSPKPYQGYYLLVNSPGQDTYAIKLKGDQWYSVGRKSGKYKFSTNYKPVLLYDEFVSDFHLKFLLNSKTNEVELVDGRSENGVFFELNSESSSYLIDTWILKHLIVGRTHLVMGKTPHHK
ncbi:hypothetical protein K8I28_16390, partial [bacterium]|nr:hypothetical protein [bacterium]